MGWHLLYTKQSVLCLLLYHSRSRCQTYSLYLHFKLLHIHTYPSSVALFVKGCSPLVTVSTGPRFPRALRKKTWDNRLKKLSASQVAEGVATNGKQTVVYASFGFGCSENPVSSMARKSIYEYADAQALNVWCIDSANGKPLNFWGLLYIFNRKNKVSTFISWSEMAE